MEKQGITQEGFMKRHGPKLLRRAGLETRKSISAQVVMSQVSVLKTSIVGFRK